MQKTFPIMLARYVMSEALPQFEAAAKSRILAELASKMAWRISFNSCVNLDNILIISTFHSVVAYLIA